jgi:hypothetical protein
MKHILVTDEFEVFNFDYDIPSDSELLTIYPSALKTIKQLKKEYTAELEDINNQQKKIKQLVVGKVNTFKNIEFFQENAAILHTDTVRQIFLIQRITFLDKILRQSKIVSSRDSIEEMKKIPITDFLEFNRAGFAKCIWHDEKTSSMKYYEKNNTIFCFGCQKHGDVIDVFAQINGISVADAIRKLKK